MCGILGQFNILSDSRVDRDKFKHCLDLLHHRGPDDSGIWYNKYSNLALGHKRLSIIDLITGHQPMMNQKENLVITFNGEIYNFPELKKELSVKGYNFRTDSDTEVILNLYDAYGINSFERLNGIFAFGIYNFEKNELVIARDKFGVKPLYYFKKNNTFAFSSEIKALLGLNILNKEIDIESLNGNIAYRFNPSPKTIFKNINKLCPGNYLKISSDEFTLDSYIKYAPDINTSLNLNDALDEYYIILKEAVKRQMISDVPVGMLLSGGIDSALITYFMQTATSQKINTYTVGFEGSGIFNELKSARETSDFIGTNHNDLIITENDYFDFFSKSFYYLEEPISITSTTSLYFIDRLASRELKVVLTGQGADELWGGYNRYKAEKLINDYRHILKLVPSKVINKLFPFNEGIRRFTEAIKYEDDIVRFNEIYSVFNNNDRKSLIIPEFFSDIVYCSDSVSNIYNQTQNIGNSMSKLLYIDTRLNLSDCLLLLADKMSMANSLELRIPYLDIELVRFIESLPIKYKIHGLKTKYLHKQLAKKILPSYIVNRKKIGFETPMNIWLNNNLGNYLRDLISATNSFSNKYFNKKFIYSLINNHKSRKENNERKLFIILTLEKWYQEYFINNY